MDEVDSARLTTGLPGGRHRPHPGNTTWTRVSCHLVLTSRSRTVLSRSRSSSTTPAAATLLPGTSADVEGAETRERCDCRRRLLGRQVLVVERGRLAEHPVEVGLATGTPPRPNGLAEGDEVVTTRRADVKPGRAHRRGPLVVIRPSTSRASSPATRRWSARRRSEHIRPGEHVAIKAVGLGVDALNVLWLPRSPHVRHHSSTVAP
jgi:hypothetical protein